MDYRDKNDLTDTIRCTYKLFITEFSTLSENHKNMLLESLDKTPAQMLSYQLGWLNLVMSWDCMEKSGQKVITPHACFKWNQLGALYQFFYSEYQQYSLEELIILLNQLTEKFLTWVNDFSEEELFTQGIFDWTGKNPKWPAVRWIHINSVAPFKTFRAKIRKFKKLL